MNILDQLQELDDIIVKNTNPPVTSMLRNKLHLIRDQVEAYVKDSEEHSALKKSQPEPSSDVPRKLCPYCHKHAGDFIGNKESHIIQERMLGLERAHYKCSNPQCGKEFNEEIK
jgi:hypothetical protein